MCPLDRRAHSSPDMLTPWEQVAHGGRTSGVDGGLDSPVSDTGDLGCFGVVVSGIGTGLRVRWWSRHPLLTTLKTGGRRMDVRLPRLA